MNQLKLAENLVFLRHKKGITQEVLADFLGISKASVSKWETGLSMPDIAQLPKIASYYDVSIDDLMGYEAQLSMKEIKNYYVKFAEDFAKKPFDEVMEEVRELIRQYYSCYPALLQMVVLLLNHLVLADTSKQPQIMEEIVSICIHIQDKCTDMNICSNAQVLQANIEIAQGKPELVIEQLKHYQDPMNITEGAESLLVQAYQMAGQVEEASEWNQVIIYRHLLQVVVQSTFYLMSNLGNKEVGFATLDRIEKIVEAYEIDKLHPNTYLQFVYVKALFFATWDMELEALETLEQFVKKAVDFIKEEYYLHGDVYFDKLDHYFHKMDAYMMMPRNQKTVLTSIQQNLEHPILAKYKGKVEFEKIKESIK